VPLEIVYRGEEEGCECRDVGSVGYDTYWTLPFGVGCEEVVEPGRYTFSETTLSATFHIPTSRKKRIS
jgi:hypothetical protein